MKTHHELVVVHRLLLLLLLLRLDGPRRGLVLRRHRHEGLVAVPLLQRLLLRPHPRADAVLLLRRKRRERVHALLVLLRGVRRAHLRLRLPERVALRLLLRLLVLAVRRRSHGRLLLGKLLLRLPLLGHVRVCVEPVKGILGRHGCACRCLPLSRFLRSFRSNLADVPLADLRTAPLSACTLSLLCPPRLRLGQSSAGLDLQQQPTMTRP